MKFLGHPIHTMLVHFPSALLPLELICSIAYRFTGETLWGNGAFIALLGAVGFGWLAVMFGLLDLLQIPRTDQAMQKRALWHGGLTTAMLAGYSVIAFLALQSYPEMPPPSTPALISRSGLILLLLLGDYLGGSLIWDLKIAGNRT